jgi:long-chain acyl-CoA synthetase
MRAARSDSDVENTMTRFSWLTELAATDPEQALLISGTRQWRAAEIRGELLRLKRTPRHVPRARRPCRQLPRLGCWPISPPMRQAWSIFRFPDSSAPGQLRHALEQTAADVVLTDQPERIGALDLGFAIIGHWRGLTWMQRVVEPVALPAGTAKISFTSGSTGAPKGVCLDGEGLIDTALAVRERLSDLPLRHHLAVLPLALLLENVAGIYAPLLRGMAMHLPPLHELGWRGMAGFDPGALDAAARPDRCQQHDPGARIAEGMDGVPEHLRQSTVRCIELRCGRWRPGGVRTA